SGSGPRGPPTTWCRPSSESGGVGAGEVVRGAVVGGGGVEVVINGVVVVAATSGLPSRPWVAPPVRKTAATNAPIATTMTPEAVATSVPGWRNHGSGGGAYSGTASAQSGSSSAP